jgi:hypothetical protein
MTKKEILIVSDLVKRLVEEVAANRKTGGTVDGVRAAWSYFLCTHQQKNDGDVCGFKELVVYSTESTIIVKIMT